MNTTGPSSVARTLPAGRSARPGTEPLRALLIDDSAMLGQLLADALNAAPELKVVRTVSQLSAVRESVLRVQPQIILINLDWAQSAPLKLVQSLREAYPVPMAVVVRSGSRHKREALAALERGVLELLEIPDVGSRSTAAAPSYANLVQHLRRLAAAARPLALPTAARDDGPVSWRASGLDPSRVVLAIGASTGGPEALVQVLKRLPFDCPPTVIVQHIPAAFSHSLAQGLNRQTTARVSEAIDGEPLTVGRVLLARGDTHLTIVREKSGWRARYTDQVRVNRHCPSVDVLFRSVAAEAGPHGIGVLLTGMGEDGARGLLEMHRAGALTCAQRRDTCTVFGMPKTALEIGAAEFSAAPQDIPAELIARLRSADRITAAR